MADGAGARRLAQLRWAGVLLLVQGALMEATVFFGAIMLLVLGIPQSAVTKHVDVLVLPYLNNNLMMLMMLMSGVFAALRIVGAVALMRNRA